MAMVSVARVTAHAIVQLFFSGSSFLGCRLCDWFTSRRAGSVVCCRFAWRHLLGSFRLVEERTRELIKIGETALNEIELTMKEQTGIVEVTFIQKADEKSNRQTSYATVFLILQYSVTGASTIGAVYAGSLMN
jgi:hypothetical protein